MNKDDGSAEIDPLSPYATPRESVVKSFSDRRPINVFSFSNFVWVFSWLLASVDLFFIIFVSRLNWFEGPVINDQSDADIEIRKVTLRLFGEVVCTIILFATLHPWKALTSGTVFFWIVLAIHGSI